MSNTRYTVAIHVLTLLAYAGPEALTSEYIAGSVNTNPVVIRRILAGLREAGLVRSQGGPGGGWQLLRAPEAVSLLEVLRAVDTEASFPLHATPPNPACPVGRSIQALLAGHFHTAQAAMERELARVSLRDLLEDVKAQPA
ncbi:Rrf2 family transcriptional regulator [Geothrix campi]|uniref:Rrf2 family transcriptional regulator n=1 Tax=Geothrix campi TaxID=2966450 RepID=UPI0021483154|nr:Rrf2 family transcriptional regulator [Geothrix sp. SG10]